MPNKYIDIINVFSLNNLFNEIIITFNIIYCQLKEWNNIT